MTTSTTDTATHLDILTGLATLEGLIENRLRQYLSEEKKEQDDSTDDITLVEPRVGQEPGSPFRALRERFQPTPAEWMVIFTALAPAISPDFFETTLQRHLKTAGDFPLLGGARGKNFRGFLPTGETILFLLAGGDPSARLRYRKLFNGDHYFAALRLLWLENVPEGEPALSGKVVLNADLVEKLLTGYEPRPHFSMRFPAERLETGLEWTDLVLPNKVLDQIHELRTWVQHGRTLREEWGMAKRIKPGYRALFHGPPGTGKTLTATLLGKETNKDVYRVDLSMVISKYIGETEKNLANLFARAENRDWILFFDEADSLFGKRTNVKDAHDRYANQEVSYLLQRVESYDGLVILASNFKSNIDEAFMRRFQSIIQFNFPSAAERLQLWESSWPQRVDFAPTVDLQRIARAYEVTGADIINIVQTVCLQLLDCNERLVTEKILLDAMRREFSKAGKIM